MRSPTFWISLDILHTRWDGSERVTSAFSVKFVGKLGSQFDAPDKLGIDTHVLRGGHNHELYSMFIAYELVAKLTDRPDGLWRARDEDGRRGGRQGGGSQSRGHARCMVPQHA